MLRPINRRQEKDFGHFNDERQGFAKRSKGPKKVGVSAGTAERCQPCAGPSTEWPQDADHDLYKISVAPFFVQNNG